MRAQTWHRWKVLALFHHLSIFNCTFWRLFGISQIAPRILHTQIWRKWKYFQLQKFQIFHHLPDKNSICLTLVTSGGIRSNYFDRLWLKIERNKHVYLFSFLASLWQIIYLKLILGILKNKTNNYLGHTNI